MEIKTFDGFTKHKPNLDTGCRYLAAKDEFSANFGEFCFDEMLDISYDVNKFLYENLKSHDWKLLKKQIIKCFGDIVEDIYLDDDKNNEELSYIVVNAKDINILLNSEKFNELVLFFNYFVTYYKNNKIYLEPKYPKTITLNDKFVYHFTKQKNVKSILKNGLRCRCGETEYIGYGQRRIISYRDFPKRVYLFTTNDDSVENLKKQCKSLCGDYYGYVVLKIKRPNNMTLYKDVSYSPAENMFFTYDNIPPQLIVDEISLF